MSKISQLSYEIDAAAKHVCSLERRVRLEERRQLRNPGCKCHIYPSGHVVDADTHRLQQNLAEIRKILGCSGQSQQYTVDVLTELKKEHQQRGADLHINSTTPKNLAEIRGALNCTGQNQASTMGRLQDVLKGYRVSLVLEQILREEGLI